MIYLVMKKSHSQKAGAQPKSENSKQQIQMKIDKQEVGRILEEIGVLLEIKGENPFKTRAYANAARVIEGFEGDLDPLVREGRLSELKGIGSGIAEKIT